MGPAKRGHAYRMSIASSHGLSGYLEHLPEHAVDHLGTRSHTRMQLGRWYQACADMYERPAGQLISVHTQIGRPNSSSRL